MNRQYLEYIPEIGTPAANSHHGQQQPLHQQPGCKAANPSDHPNVKSLLSLGGPCKTFQAVADVKFMHVPYKGSSLVLNDLIGGQVDVAFDYAVGTWQHVQSGKLRALAVTGPKRLPLMPDVPTVGELGLPQAESGTWLGLFFSARTPAVIVQRWQSEVAQTVREPAYIDAVSRMGAEPLELGGAQFAAMVDSDRKRMKEFVKKTGAKAE